MKGKKMGKSKTALDNEVRQKYVAEVMEKFAEDQPMLVAGNVIAFPTLDEENGEAWVEITVKVPKGARLGKGEGYAGYDGYALAESYQIDLQEKATAAKATAEKKAKAKAKKEEKGE